MILELLERSNEPQLEKEEQTLTLHAQHYERRFLLRPLTVLAIIISDLHPSGKQRNKLEQWSSGSSILC